jgi:hypothetical protein
VNGTRARLLRLAEKRVRLSENARAERERLGSIIERSDALAPVLQGARRIADELRRQPWIVAAGVALLFALRPKRAFGWLAKGWSAWRLYRGALRWWQQIAAAQPR